MVEKNAILGENVHIFDPNLVNIWGCSIGDNTFIGPFVEITKGVKIGKNCKIESHSFICDQVTLQDNVFVGHGVMFINDLYPSTKRQVKRMKILIKKGVSVGSNSTILPNITIGEYSIIGGGAVITKDVPSFSIVVGNPAKIIKKFNNIKQLKAYVAIRQPTFEMANEI